MTCIGQLNKRLIIQDVQLSPDGVGGFQNSWVVFATVWAKVRSRHVGEKLIGDVVTSTTSHLVTLRYLDGLRPRMRFVAGARTYQILSIINVGEEDKWLTCLCRERPQ